MLRRFVYCCYYNGVALRIFTSTVGLSDLFVCTLPIRWITSIPLHTRPKIACLLSKWGVGANVI